uniref:NADH-ubiquinone oxidoreductase chain 2 n=1 Tax=Sinopyrophorus schimmeli TaxID=2488820 RepID=A0A3G5FPQ4_9COLE|nr:NADH dehydrogenase subunit 2 [Elateridae sp. JWH-2018]
MMKFYKLAFLSILCLSTLISISSYTWLGMWLGLEINLLSIIPLMHDDKNVLASEATIKYFIVQATASAIILMSIISLSTKTSWSSNFDENNPFILIMNSSFLTKMGMAPFHFWFPEVMEGLNWMNCLLIMTWQKLAPMVLLMYNMKFNLFITMVIMTAMVISGVMGINQISLRKILAYSSINHMGWMLSTMMVMKTIWIYYFLIYSLMTLNLTIIFNKFKVFFLNQLFQTLNSNILIKMFFILNFLSLSGIPPFLGFLPKWMTVQALVENEVLMLPLVMIVFTLITIYMYMRITLTSLIMNSEETKWSNLLMPSTNKFNMAMMNFFMITSLIMVTFIFNIL